MIIDDYNLLYDNPLIVNRIYHW